MPAPHPPEFRRRAVELARLSEQSIAALAKQLSISESCLRNWLAQAKSDDATDGSRLTTGEKKELTQPRRDKRRLERENRDPQTRGGVLRPGEHPPKLAYRLVHEMADDTDVDIDVAVAPRVLGVSRSGYDDWLGRPPSARTEANTSLLKHITEVHQQSRETYGWPRVHAELTLGLGLAVNHKRVARLMREAGLQGLYRRQARRGPTGPATEDDLVHRKFTVDAPDRLWLTDITEHPTNEGRLYCAAVMDAYSRRIIGWSIAAHLRTELVLDALGMAILRRRPAGDDTIMHSDHGTQYTSWGSYSAGGEGWW